MNKYALISLIITLLLMGTIGLLPIDKVPESTPIIYPICLFIKTNDKLVHFLMFMLATIQTLMIPTAPLEQKTRLQIACGWSLISFISELIQGLLIPYRTWDSEDVAANLCGVAVGCLLEFLWMVGWTVWADGERWWRLPPSSNARRGDLELHSHSEPLLMIPPPTDISGGSAPSGAEDAWE